MERKSLEKLERLLRVATHIEQVYDKLLILEKEGEKYSPIYKKTVKYLKLCIDNEKEIYDRDYNDFFENEKLIEYLEQECTKVRKPIYTDEFILFENDFSNKVVQRIINKLEGKIVESKEITRYMEEEHNAYGINPIEIDMLMQDDKAGKLFIYKRLLSDIEENIDNPNYRSYRNSLMEIKYDLAFVYDFLEENMIETGFNVSNEHINLTELQIALSADLYSQSIDRILEISDADYRKEENGIRAIILQSVIKSYLSLLPKEILLHNLETFDSIKQKEEDYDYRISERIVLLSFKQALEEKKKKEEKRK